MPDLATTRTKTHGNLFLPGLPPRDVPEDRYRELGELHGAAIRRGEAPTGVEGPLNPGGWNLTAPLEYFDQLEAIAAAILSGNSATFQAYRGH